MKTNSIIISAIVAASFFAAGCGSHCDLTQTPEIQKSGILGTCVRTTQPLDLFKDNPSDTLRLVTKDHPSYGRGERIGQVAAGTRLCVNQVVRISELAGFMVFPMYYHWTCTMARIEDGPHAGKEIAVGGMLDKAHTATLGSSYLAPTD
jgi:hypothetical protein